MKQKHSSMRNTMNFNYSDFKLVFLSSFWSKPVKENKGHNSINQIWPELDLCIVVKYIL